MKTIKVFYSWQSDLPNATNRGFIEKALENAVKAIRNDESIKVEPVIDRDTQGVAGTPDIANTIFEKIDQAQIFVCDVSIINNGAERPTPNPNVLIELGYAKKSRGTSRIIMVQNTAFGKTEQLPFDLRPKRVTTYNMAEAEVDRATERKNFEKALEGAIRLIINEIESQVIQEEKPISTSLELAIAAIEGNKQNQEVFVRNYMDWLAVEIKRLNPNFSAGGEMDDLLVQAIDQSEGVVIGFATLAKSISETKAAEAAGALYKGFDKILEGYAIPMGFQGIVLNIDFDFYKYIGHELFTVFFSFLIKNERWEIIASLLEEDFYLNNAIGYQVGTVPFGYIGQYVQLLDIRSNRLKLNIRHLRADTLKSRYSHEELEKLVPFQQFMEADFFLFLRSWFSNPDKSVNRWKAQSTYFMKQLPAFFVKATKIKYAEKLLQPLGVENINDLRIKFDILKESLKSFVSDYFYDQIEDFDIQVIGSQK